MSKGNEIFEALSVLEVERGIPVDFMIDKIKKAIFTACKNSYNGNDDAIVDIDNEKGVFDVRLMKTVVEEVLDKGNEITIKDAKKINKNALIGEKIPVKLDTKEFGRIAAQTARNIIRQGIRDGERSQIMKEFQKRYQELVSAVVEKVDDKSGNATIKIGKAETILPKNEQLPNDNIKEGDHIKVYIVDVRESEKGPKVIISRTHPDLVKRLFETEVPEIHDGLIEIKSVSREAGLRTKIAVYSNEPEVDAVGACIGTKGNRVCAVVNELGGEKIDIIEYSEDPIKFICSALSPANVISVKTAEGEERVCKVIVPDNQLSLAIGNRGQNVRLAAKLTGWKIDIKPESELIENGDIENSQECKLETDDIEPEGLIEQE